MANSGHFAEAATAHQVAYPPAELSIPSQLGKPITVEALVSLWVDSERQETGGLLKRGEATDRYLLQALGKLASTNKREQKRETLIAELAARLNQERVFASGLRIKRINRIIACWHVAELLAARSNDASEVSSSVLYAFLPLIEREPGTDRWFLRPEFADGAKRIWQRIISGHFGPWGGGA